MKTSAVGFFVLAFASPLVSCADETITGPYTEANPLNLTISEGTNTLTGAERIVLGDVLVTGSSSTKYGTLRIENAKEVVFTNNAVEVGTLAYFDESRATKIWPRIVVSNSFFGTTQLGSKTYEGTLNLGKYMSGLLEVEAGGVVSNRLFVGGGSKPGGTYEGHAGESVGAVYQRGGTVYALGKGKEVYHHSALGLCATHGSYSLEGGLFQPLSTFSVGLYAGGVLMQTGGQLYTTRDFYIGHTNGGHGHYCLTGGTAYLGGLFVTVCGNSGYAILSVVGPNTLFQEDYGEYGGMLRLSSGFTGATTTINVNDGGTLECGGFYVMRNDYTSPFANVLNVNGGIIRARSAYNWTRFFGGASNNQYLKQPLDRVAVYEKGMTFDTNSTAYDLQTYGTIVGAGAGGISRLELAEPIANVYAVPAVEITGDGYGATAAALLDTVNHCVTNILLTSRGWGYTKAGTTIKVLYNKYQVKKTLTADEFDIGTTDAGGFTKAGNGKLTLTAGTTNTWQKWTRVYGGTLAVGGESGLPTNTVLTLKNGAVLDLNHTASSVKEVLHGFGGGTIANAENATVPSSVGYVIDLDEALAGKTVTLPAGTDLATTKLVFRGDLSPLLADGQRHPLFVAKSGSFTGTPTVTVEPAQSLPDDWKWYVRGGTVGVAPVRGMVLLLR